MVLYVFTFIFLLIFLYFTFNFVKFLSLTAPLLAIFAGYILDMKVDEIVEKAVIISEVMADNNPKSKKNRNSWTRDNSVAIITDVMLGNGINPRDYNLGSLVDCCRYRIDLYSTKEGGEYNGNS